MTIAKRYEGDPEHGAALHGDAVGYSRLMADNEIETHHTVQTFQEIIQREAAANGGELEEFVGDEFLAVFITERDAVLAAIEIQRKVAAENAHLPEGRQMQFRLGVNAGKLTVAGGQWYGEAINVAARLQALAQPGSILVSRAVLDAAGDLDVRVVAIGQQRLKNIPEPVFAFRLVDDGLPSDTTKPWRGRIVPSPRPSLAVSPFVNLGDPDDVHFADGLMMSLVISLMQIPGLDVISENSSLAYRDGVFSSQQIGHELGVRYVLEGSVQRSRSRVRVVTQLIDADSSNTVWGDRFEASIEDTFAAQDDLVAAIVKALDIEVLGGASARLYREHLDAETIEMIYRGWSAISKGTPEAVLQARAEFERASESAPEDAVGWTMAAWTYFWEGYMGFVDDPGPGYIRAEELARKAVELGDVSAIAHVVLAHVLLHRHDWEGAVREAAIATDQRPSCDVTFGVAASVMRYLGRWEEAIDLAARAMRLSPLLAEWYESVVASAYFVGKDYSMATETAETVISSQEDNVEALLTLAASQNALGHNRHAKAAIDQARATRPTMTSRSLRDQLPYRETETLDRFVEGLQSAGLE